MQYQAITGQFFAFEHSFHHLIRPVYLTRQQPCPLKVPRERFVVAQVYFEQYFEQNDESMLSPFGNLQAIDISLNNVWASSTESLKLHARRRSLNIVQNSLQLLYNICNLWQDPEKIKSQQSIVVDDVAPHYFLDSLVRRYNELY